jgi:hypothetical protein
MNISAQIIGGFLIYVLAVSSIFLILRPLMLWYWKINVIVKIMEEQKEILREQKNLLEKIYSKKDP